MKKLFCSMIIVTSFCTTYAQMTDNTMPPLDKSPMDMAYYPNNYPILKIQNKATEPLAVRIIYSRPQKNNRTIFGELIKNKEVWRLGANEATEIEFFKDVRIDNKRVLKGRYTLYAIPDSTQWTIIVNKDTDIWGAFKYNEKKDVLRVNVPVQTTPQPIEAYSMTFEKTPAGANLIMAWDTQMVSLPILLK